MTSAALEIAIDRCHSLLQEKADRVIWQKLIKLTLENETRKNSRLPNILFVSFRFIRNTCGSRESLPFMVGGFKGAAGIFADRCEIQIN